VIPVRAEPGGGEAYLLLYAQTEPGPQLSLFIRSTRQVGPSGPEARSLEQFTATGDRGTRYQMKVRDLGGGTGGWTLMLEPSPPYDPQWLDLISAPGQPAVRVDLNRSARPPQDATVTAGPVTASPGDHVLHAVAGRLLAKDDLLGFRCARARRGPGRWSPAPRGSATSSRPCRRPARCPRSARCPGSSPRCAPACTSLATASPPRPPAGCPKRG
jgi:hypothetical protein